MSPSSVPGTAAVRTQHEGDILVVTIDHPPVNALNVDVRRGLRDAVQQAQADARVRAVLIVGAGRAFIAGADIREFGKPPLPPSLPEVCNGIEACTKPVIAAIHGPALGGGLEIAMSAHYRLALGDARLGLPEVQLGLLPGSGGTQRAPRLMGLRPAVELMLSGRHMGAKEALGVGLIDRLAEGSDVRAGDEGAARAHNQHGTHLSVGLRLLHGLKQAPTHLHIQGIDRRVVDGHEQDMALALGTDDWGS